MQQETKDTAAGSNIPVLNDDCLVHIFEKCSDYDLINISKSSAYFAYLLENFIYKPRTRYLPMVGHYHKPSIMKRTSALSYMDRYEIGQNWQYGRYSKPIMLYGCTGNSHKMHLDSSCVYVATGCVISMYLRGSKNDAYVMESRCSNEIRSSSNLDIVDFVKKEDTIFDARFKYAGFIHENNVYTELRLHNINEQINCIDFASNTYASCSNQKCKIWKRSDEFELIHLDCVLEFKQTYEIVRFNELGNVLFGGCKVNQTNSALQEINVHTGSISQLKVQYDAVKDLKLKDEHTFFVVGNLPVLQLYDRRTQCAELSWMDEFELPFNCIEYDGLHGLLCSTGRYKKVDLFDMRKPGGYIQAYTPYYAVVAEEESSIFSIVADSRYLFCALKNLIFVYDFKTSTT